MAFTRPRAGQIDFDLTNITDPIIRLNSGETGQAGKDTGIVLERGDDTNVAILFDESANEFVLVNTNEGGNTNGNVTISSYADLQVATINTATLEIGGTAVTSTAAELNTLDGVTATTAELNILDGVTATTAELNYVDGVTSNIQTQLDAKAPLAGPTFTGTLTYATLNDGTTALTSTAAELNVLDGVTATTAELNILDGVTSTAAEINLLDGVTGIALGNANELVIVDSDGTGFASSSTLSIDDGNNYIGINQTSPEVTLHMTGESSQTAQIRMEQYNDNADAPDIRTRRYRGTVATPAAVQSGDYLFRSNHEYYNGTGLIVGGSFAFDNTNNAARTQFSVAVDTDGTGANPEGNNGQFKIDGNDGGAITFNNAYKFPTSDGSANQFLQTNGSGTITFESPTVSDISDLTATATELNYVDGVTSAIQTQLDAKLALAGGTMSGAIAMGTNKITGMGDPTANQDAATKAYVDTQTSSIVTTTDIAGDTGTDTVTLGSDTLTFSGTANEIATAVTDNTVTISLPDDVTIGSDLTVTGNLTVSGTTTTISTTNSVVSDSLIELNTGAASNANDLGIVMERGSTGDNAIFAWDESADAFVMGTTTATGTSTGDLTIANGELRLDTLRIDQSGAGLRMTNVGAFDNDGSDNFRIFATNDLKIAANGDSGTAITIDATNQDVTITNDLRVTAGQFYYGGTAVTSTAAELNILDGVTSTASELNIIDGDTSATSTTLADADRVVVNDAGTMKQVALTDFETYFETALDTLSNVTSVGTLNGITIASTQTIDMGSNRVTQVADPVGDQDAATKAYVDANASSGGGTSGFTASTFTTAPGADGDFDLAFNVAQDTQETPFEAGGTDAFGVALGEVYDMMEPVGSTSVNDMGAFT